MKHNNFIYIVHAFCLLLAVAIGATGCNPDVNERRRSIIPWLKAQSLPADTTIIRMDGEALTEGEANPEVRVAAIVNALHRLARYDAANMAAVADTQRCWKDWDGLKLDAICVNRYGVTALDSVTITLISGNQGEPPSVWKTRNLKLVAHPSGDDAGLSLLLAALQERGFTASGRMAARGSIWREQLVYKLL